MTTDLAADRAQRFAPARLVADAVLYEGYVLYPYHTSAQKNQHRWQFGVLVPPAFARSSVGERSGARTEVVVDPGADPTLHVRVRCLQVQRREAEGRTDVVPWDEAVEHDVDLPPLRLRELVGAAHEHAFLLPSGEDVEVHDDAGGRTVRRREAIDGVVRVRAGEVGALLVVAVEVDNVCDWHEAGVRREVAMRHSLVAVHTLLAVDGGAFVSLLDPPASAAAAVAGCTNDGTFPVLVGGAGTSDLVLSSPIILYDQPAVAPESAGDFCDATEIDEILALRVMTMTDAEKAEARATDARAAAIVDRCDDLPEEVWTRLHGVARPVDAASVPWWDPGTDAAFDPFTDALRIGDHVVSSGTRVRLHPSRRADAHDLFYADLPATVRGVFNDVDGHQHVAVVLDDDPAAELFDWQGRFLYFHPDEIEVVE